MMDHSPASIAGRFKILELIGQGAMGTIYLGIDTTSGEQVAMKRLRPEVVAENPSAVDRFKHEGHTLGKLNHPSIVRFVSMTEDSGHLYLITEHVPGGSLKELLAEKTYLTVRRVVEVALDLADALSSAHDLGIIHRDIKPTNILFAEDGTPRLADFGVALCTRNPVFNDESPPLIVSSDQSIQRNGEKIGTMAYMSPESYRGEAVGPESDIWSLGLVMFEMLTGRLPFEDEQAGGFVTAVATRPIPAVIGIRPEIPDELAALVREMVERDLAERLSDAREVVGRLEVILHGLEVSERGPSAGENALPEYATPFVGRERELEQLTSWLRDPSRRLISLVGPGGVGKSRLAVEASLRLGGQFPDGVWFVPLTPVGSPRHAVQAIAAGMGFSFRGPADPGTQLLNYLREKNLLLVLDNFEHLLESVDLLEEIVAVASQARILVTSREVLGLRAETVVEIGGLPYPPADSRELGSYDAVQLFLQCADRVSTGFSASAEDMEAIGRICGLVDGAPLGIELAASWTKSLPCTSIASEISSNLEFVPFSGGRLGERHRSLRAVFDHSWQLLYESERTVFARLSVFRGGFTLSAGRRVAGASLALLSALVGKSLLRVDSADRYETHELLRQYAGEHLDARQRDQEEVSQLHADFYAGFLQQREENLSLSGKTELREVDVEIDNIRAAWNSVLRQSRLLYLEHFIGSLHHYYGKRALYADGDETFGQAVGALLDAGVASDDHRRLLGRALACQATILARVGRNAEAQQLAKKSYSTLTRANLRAEMAFPGYVLGCTMMQLGDYTEADALLREALQLSREAEKWQRVAACLNVLGTTAFRRGDLPRARSLREESLEMSRRIGDNRGVMCALGNLAGVEYSAGNVERARQLLNEALQIERELGANDMLASSLSNLALLHAKLEEYDQALALYRESLVTWKALGNRGGMAHILEGIGRVRCRTGQYDEARRDFLEAVDICRETGNHYSLVMCHLGLAEIAFQGDRYGESAGHCREALKTALRIDATPRTAEAAVSWARSLARTGAEDVALGALLVAIRTGVLDDEDSRTAHDEIARLEHLIPPEKLAAVKTRAEFKSLDELAAQLLTISDE